MIGNMIEFKHCLSFFFIQRGRGSCIQVYIVISIVVSGHSCLLQFVSSHGKIVIFLCS